jgi:hypothetical protein
MGIFCFSSTHLIYQEGRPFDSFVVSGNFTPSDSNPRQNPELSRLRHWPKLSAACGLHVYQAVVRHGFERSRQVAGLAACGGGEFGDGLRLALPDGVQQRPVFVAQHFRQRAHGCEPNFGVAGFGFDFAFGNGQYALTNLLLRQDADGDGFHGLFCVLGLQKYNTLCYIMVGRERQNESVQDGVVRSLCTQGRHHRCSLA